MILSLVSCKNGTLFRQMGKTFFKGGCMSFNWAAHWSRTFLHVSYPMNPSGSPRMLPATLSFYFIVLPLMRHKLYRHTAVYQTRQTVEKVHSALITGLDLLVKLLPGTCSPQQPQCFGLYLFSPWRDLFPKHLQMKVSLSDQVVTCAPLLQCHCRPLYKYFSICPVPYKPIKNM